MKTRGFNTSYGAAYYPAVQVRDRGTNTVLYVPATVAAMAALGYTDNVAFPWFAPAGFNRGGLSDGSSGIVATGVSKRLTSRERDELYDVNVNPIAQFPQEGVVIFGQKTLQSTRTALDRVNVRRLLIYVKKEISRIANSILFEPNVRDTWNRFIAQAEPFLDGVKADFGLTDYRLILDETTTTPELIDRNTLYARVLLKPARAIEFIAIDFEIFRSGASFDD
jgi:phage tail sheath protein FI